GHFGVEIGKDGRTSVIFRMIGIVDVQIFDDNTFRHVCRVTEIMLPRIGASDQDRTGRSSSCRHENTIADDEFSLPGTAVVGAKINKGSSVKGGILYQKSPAANSVYSHVSKCGIANSGVGHTHMSIKPGKG